MKGLPQLVLLLGTSGGQSDGAAKKIFHSEGLCGILPLSKTLKR